MSKLAWVTGGSSGIGFAIAERLMRDDWKVAISGRDRVRLDAAVEKLGDNAIPLQLDVTDAKAMKYAVERLTSEHGTVNTLVANAGMNVGKRAWGEVSNTDFEGIVSANLVGVFSSIDAVLDGMRAKKNGRIVVLSSFAGWHITPQPGPAYSSSKMAVRGLVDSLNMSELRNGIVATSLCPGEVATPAMERRVPPPSPETLARMLQPEDIASAVHYILSQPERVAINEMVISPSWNNAYNRVPGPSPDS
ncbi:SDR family oxidoreductase [Tropicibacter sp. Alg240-R139]|uniref:SDR family oxidoreductase n=1 Tax=Tropicibacter sp. Alg240-R139 TaxID=2305991 RepID=UPI0013DF4E4E|nr:SDR family oxidoreductase [Tropicibacter sp. Alg240-R139]